MDALRETLVGYIDWIRAFHIIAVITWMAALLYLPRLFVYHADSQVGTPMSERFKVMERRLIRGIMNPSSILVWILGPLLAWITQSYADVWLHIKFLLVILLTGLHHFFVRCWKDFDNDRNMRSPRFYRIVNEVPAVLMVVIVILVKVKPFS